MPDVGDNHSYGSTTSGPCNTNVRDGYLAPGDSVEIEVHSPVTGRNYTMACVRTGDIVTCRGEDEAVVTFAV